MFRCEDVLKELGNYLDDDTALAVRRDLEEHLRCCRACSVLVDTTRKTIRIVTGSSTFELPASLSDKIMARVLGHRDTEDS